MLPRLALSPRSGLDPRLYFSPRASADADAGIRETWLEIGFGGGEHLLWQAAAHPEAGIIGAEPYVSGVAKLLSKLAQAGAGKNIRIYMEDARDILESLPDATLARVFVLFPDPWPKKRHHKRRFIQTEMLDELARVMRPGAELRFATDENGYLVWALERLMAHPAFAWGAETSSDWRQRPLDWPQTRYEAKALKDRRICTYLKFLRRAQ